MLKDGDFVKIEYSVYRAIDNSLVYTTNEELAKKNNIYDEKQAYKPILIVIGKDHIVKGVDKVIKDMNVGEEKKIELEPKDAYGERNQDLVRVISINDFRKRDIEPYPGLKIDLDGLPAVVTSVNSGRVIVDANHPLAGEKVVFDIKIIEKVEKTEDKLKELFDSYSLSPSSYKIENKVLNLTFDSKIKKDADYLIKKSNLVNAILNYLDEIEKVVSIEEYEKEKEKEEPKKS